MPESRFVPADRLLPLLGFLAGAVVVILVADVLLRGLDAPGWLVRLVVVVWMLSIPTGCWRIWRRAGEVRSG